MAEAATAGDYAAVQELADLARAVARLAAASTPPVADETPEILMGARIGKVPAKGKKPAAGEPPQFFRRGDDLVKVGWSKDGQRKYQHRAPRAVVTATAAAVRRVGAGGAAFTGDSLMPVRNPADGSGLPEYQVYVALAWLKQLGLVAAIGQRGGYTLQAEKGMDAALSAAWPKLSEWTG